MRQPFLDFPMHLKGWSGTSFPLEARYVEVLKFDDYVLADYQQLQSPPVNLYIAYYRSQRKGQSAHSPQRCIPGGGWEITSKQKVDLPIGGLTEPVNRVLIQKDRQKQLVVYWFKQRDRILSNEYLVKLYLLWDALTRQGSDGALIRLSAAVDPGDDEQAVSSDCCNLHNAFNLN